MKKNIYNHIEYLEISTGSKKKLLKGSPSAVRQNGPEKQEYYYVLENGTVLYEILDVKNYLFSNKTDYDKFINFSINEASKDNFLDRPIAINDEAFIDNRFNYIKIFEKEFNLELDFHNVNTAKNLTPLLNGFTIADIHKNSPAIIAIIGGYLANNLKDAQWKWVNIPTQGRFPMIVTLDRRIIDPSGLLNKEVKKKVKKKDFVISIFRQINKVL